MNLPIHAIQKTKATLIRLTCMKRTTGIFTLVAVNIAAIGSLNNLPALAVIGFNSVSYYLIAMALFFVPYSLIVAELSSAFPDESGIYIWVKSAFGARWGFVAVWLQWIENVFWYPTILSFVAAGLTYFIDPALAANKTYNIVSTLTIYWTLTLANLCGVRVSNAISLIGSSLGILLPGILLVVMGVFWYGSHETTHLVVGWHQLIPNLHQYQNFAFLVGIAQTLAGLEMSAVQSHNVINPKRAFPIAILISAFGVCVLSIFGSLAIAALVPSGEIDLNNGVIQAFIAMLHGHKLLLETLSVLVALGGMTAANAWIIGPSTSLEQAAEDQCIPRIFKKVSDGGVSPPIILLQAVCVTLLCGMFVLMPTVSSAYWLLTVLAGQLYLMMYVLMFAAAIKLRVNKTLNYSYEIGNVSTTCLVSGIGAAGSFAFMLFGFFPPANMATSILYYVAQFTAFIVMLLLPLLIYYLTQLNIKPIDINKSKVRVPGV
jgi:glutamate:GABA antiporter